MHSSVCDMHLILLLGMLCMLINFISSVQYFCDDVDWTSNPNNTEISKCKRDDGYINGLWRDVSPTPDREKPEEQVTCCAPQTLSKAECISVPLSFNESSIWNTCPEGYFINGLERSSNFSPENYLQNIKRARCCKPVEIPEQWGSCYNEDMYAIFKNKSSRSCKENFMVTGFHRSTCDLLNCIDMLKCCKILTSRDGSWGRWSDWNSCDVSCDGGVQNRTRICDNPEPWNGGRECMISGKDLRGLNETGIRLCNIQPCPVNGNWNHWSNWSSCSASCGRGFETRNRTCNNPPPAFGGFQCLGCDKISLVYKESMSRFCKWNPCPVDGNWSEWGEWSSCSSTCGGGQQMRIRICDNPPPLHMGKQCLLSNSTERNSTEIKFRICNTLPCPVDGKWLEWSSWSECTVTCGGGRMERNRTCREPVFGGMKCLTSGGTALSLNETVSSWCNTSPCPLDGNWGPWTAWSSCNVTCGGGQRFRNRSCNNPLPIHHGRPCFVSNFTERSLFEILSNVCNTSPCPVDGNWGQWSSWSPCNVACGGGRRTRDRSCDHPLPLYGGQQCILTDKKNRSSSEISSKLCNINPCPVNGHWGHWGEWSPCNVTCGGGQKVRGRICNDPVPLYHGQPCLMMNKIRRASSELLYESCNKLPCPAPAYLNYIYGCAALMVVMFIFFGGMICYKKSKAGESLSSKNNVSYNSFG